MFCKVACYLKQINNYFLSVCLFVSGKARPKLRLTTAYITKMHTQHYIQLIIKSFIFVFCWNDNPTQWNEQTAYNLYRNNPHRHYVGGESCVRLLSAPSSTVASLRTKNCLSFIDTSRRQTIAFAHPPLLFEAGRTSPKWIRIRWICTYFDKCWKYN